MSSIHRRVSASETSVHLLGLDQYFLGTSSNKFAITDRLSMARLPIRLIRGRMERQKCIDERLWACLAPVLWQPVALAKRKRLRHVSSLALRQAAGLIR